MTAIVIIQCDQPVEAGFCGSRCWTPHSDAASAEQYAFRAGWYRSVHGHCCGRCPR